MSDMLAELHGASVCSEDADEAWTSGDRADTRVLTFLLGAQPYAIPLANVIEIQHLVQPIPLPAEAPAVLGLIDFRGRVVPAVDGRALVGLPGSRFTLETPMVLCRVRQRPVALVVDGVIDVVELPAKERSALSKTSRPAEKLLGVAHVPGGTALVLDLERLVSGLLETLPPAGAVR